MTIGIRIKEVRKELGYTQQVFADKLGLKRNTIGGYEIGTVVPSDRTISDICREFNVSEVWLRTGEGEMFNDVAAEQELTDVFAEIAVSDDDLIKRIIRAYWELDEKEKAAIRKLIDGFSRK